jgi:hypothetical protein
MVRWIILRVFWCFGENLLAHTAVPEFERSTRHTAHAGTSRETKERHPVQAEKSARRWWANAESMPAKLT